MTTLIKRTPGEIVERMKELGKQNRDLFGSERSQLLEALPWDVVVAQNFMRPDQTDHTEENWATNTRMTTLDAVREKIRDYLPFAWQKANDSQGMSAERSICYFMGLLWLLGNEHNEARERMEGTDTGLRTEHAFYGKPALVTISEIVGFDWAAADNDKWHEGPDTDFQTAREALGR